MAARYRIALHGFSDFERDALSFCLKHAGVRVPAYTQVRGIADCDFIVADASHAALPGSVVRGERMRDTLFIGDNAPHGAAAQLSRPLDPERILRALDHMVLQRIAPRRPAEPPDVVLPVPELRFPILDTRDIVEETTPAAFQHEPLELHLKEDLAAEAGAAALDPAAKAPSPPALPADDLAPPPAPRRPASAPAGSGPVGMADEERHAAKEAARRKSRAVRLAQSRKAAKAITEVLLLDDATEPVPLEFLLEAFGFQVLRATDIDGAMRVLENTPIAAAFLQIGVDNDDGIDGLALCQLIKQGRMALAGDVPPVMLLTRRKLASEGVRAKLAGCDAYLAPPVRRGDAARALEACNVALPDDERRSAR